MRRRDLLTAALVSLAAICAQVHAVAQEPSRVYRLGVLSPTTHALHIVGGAILSELDKLGFVKGRNVVTDERAGTIAQLPALASEVAARQPEAIIAIGSDAVAAAAAATGTVPIIVFGSDPVLLGLAATLHHPGQNVTGRVIFGPELDAKRLQLLHDAVPHAKRVAALVHAAHRLKDASLREMRVYAAGSRLDLLVFEVAGPEDYASAFKAMREAGAQALTISAYPQFGRDAEVLARLALAAELPTACEWREMAERGCLLGYGPSRVELFRGVADYVARVLKGAAPSTLPIIQPTTFEFAVNLKTAKALGLSIPHTLLARADEVIE